MFASSLGKDDRTTGKDGIVQGHTYSIISVHEFMQSKVRLLKLRNPWGHQEWNGDWCDDSPLWTPQMKAEIELIEKDDGVFWIPHGDFMRRFESAAFSAYSERTYHSNILLEFGKTRTACFRFVLNDDNNNLQANPFALSLFQ
jgi:calpain-15